MTTKLYLISPPKFDLQNFSSQLETALATKQIPVFQLRLKNLPDEKLIETGKKLLEICRKYQTSFILNDRLDLALKIGADGVHLGSEDGKILTARKNSPKNFILGASCYDSKHSAMIAGEEGADYISFGTFFPSKTKNSNGKPTTEILEWCRDYINIPSVAIGGITAENCAPLVKAGADFLAIISYIWDHEKGVEFAIEFLVKKMSEIISRPST
jgi:thiamine-phosphate pyrophosphorylase